MPDHLAWPRKLIYGLLVAVLIFGVLEGLIRLLDIDPIVQNRFFVLNRALDYPDVFDKDHDLFWRLRPNQTITSQFFEGRTYNINSLGLRGYKVPPKSNKIRVLVLGNSCTFGWGVTLNETYAEQLGQSLGDRFEIINGGIPGYTSYQGRIFFERELVDLKPDYVLMMFGWNDHWAAANQIADKDQKFPPAFVISIQNFLARFHSYRLLKRLLINSTDPDVATMFDRENPVYRVSVSDFSRNLTTICTIAREHGATPIVLTAPIPSANYYLPVKSDFQKNLLLYHNFYNEMARQTASEDGVTMVDIAREFDKYNDLYDNVSADFIHFNARGHRVASEMIHRALVTSTIDTIN